MSGGLRMSIPMNCEIHPYHTLEGCEMNSRPETGDIQGPSKGAVQGLRGDSVGVCALSTCFRQTLR